MEARWNHDIPDEYFTDPQYNAGYAQSTMRHDSGHHTSSSRKSDSPYSSYLSRSYYEAPSPCSQLQSPGSAFHPYQPNSYHSSPYSSQLSTSQYKPSSSTRHNSTSTSCTSPFSLTSSTPSPPSGQLRERHYCEHSSCVDRHGQRSSFSRRADLNRHAQSVHGPNMLDCPWRRCERKGSRGFPRLDHLIEHRRGFHHEDIPKREGAR
jgi:hypothetical protein